MNLEATIYKLTVLFLLSQSREDLTNSQISDFVLGQSGTNYFFLQQAVSELAETGFISKYTIGNKTLYKITREGNESLTFFGEDLSPEIREKALDWLKKNEIPIANTLLFPAECFAANGSIYVRCRILEGEDTLFELTASVPTREAGEAMCKAWPVKSQTIYQNVMNELV